MATFTMRLHTILGVDSPDDADASLIGLDRYPIWDEGYRSELNHKIVMRFWNREIGHETVGMFVHAVRRKMGEIMPYYSQLAETATWKFDPFETINVEHTTESETDGTANTSGTAEGETSSNESSTSKQASGSESLSRTVSSEHPQTRLNNYEDYATASQDGESKSTNESKATSQGEGSQSDTQTSEQDSSQQQHQTGKQTSQGTQGNKSAMLEQYRATLIGVDTMILDELETLFMGVWDTDHSYTTMGSYPLYLF